MKEEPLEFSEGRIADERLTAKKPLKQEFSDWWNVVIAGCPSCEAMVDNTDKYCSNCGQKLDWSEQC